MNSSLTWFVLPLLLVVGCSRAPDPPLPAGDSSVLSHKVHDAAAQRGKVIVSETFSVLSSNLQSAIQQGGVSNALPFCSLAASPITAGMASKHGVAIRRVTHKPRNPANRADATELAVLNHFKAALTSTNPPPPMVTNFTAETVTFFAPIVLNNELCLKCHGERGKDILAENIAVIERLYPPDEATGFKLGELRGAWRIDIPLASLP